MTHEAPADPKRAMTLGDFRARTKDLPDDSSLSMAVMFSDALEPFPAVWVDISRMTAGAEVILVGDATENEEDEDDE